MESLALKLIVTPLFIGAASAAGRRWGRSVSGWFVGFPLTSGPIAFFVALDQGASFAAATAAGSLAGSIAQAAFCLAYGWSAVRGHWLLALLLGSLAFALATTMLQHSAFALGWLVPGVIVTLGLAIRLMPRGAEARVAAPAPSWDIPARMVVTTSLVVLLTSVAPLLGPRLSGLLATFPLYGGILAVFAHHREGPAPAVQVLRGLLLGLFAFAAFFLVLALLIERVGLIPAFLAAIAVSLAIQAGSLRIVLATPAATSGRIAKADFGK